MCYLCRGDGGWGLYLIEVSEVVRQPERPHKQRLGRVRLLAKIVDGVLEAVAVLPYYRLAPLDFFGRDPPKNVERPERAVSILSLGEPDGHALRARAAATVPSIRRLSFSLCSFFE